MSGRKRPDPFVLEVDAWTGSSVETQRLSTHSFTTSSSDTAANTFYNGALIDPGKISRSLFEGGATSGRASITTGNPVIANTGEFDAWFSYGLGGHDFVLKLLAAADAPLSTAVTIWRGKVLGLESSDVATKFSLRLADAMADLDKPFLTARYGGTTISTGLGADGDVDMKGQLIPRAYGPNLWVPGKLVNRFDLIWQFAGNAQSSITVFDGGVALTYIGDFGSISALVNATINPGEYGTCLAQGCARLGASPAFAVTAHLVDGATASLRSAARVAARMLSDFGVTSIVDDDFDAAHTFNDAEVRQYIDSDVSAIDAISPVVGSIGGGLIATLDQEIGLKILAEPALVPAGTLTLRQMLGSNIQAQLFAGPASDGNGIPAYSVVVNWGHIPQVFGDSDLAGVVDLATREFLKLPFRTTEPATDVTVQTAYPNAVVLTFDSCFTTQADAEAEAARRLALYKVRRDRITFPASWDDGDHEIGETVKVAIVDIHGRSRFGYGAGKNFLVIGREDDFRRKVRTLMLWG